MVEIDEDILTLLIRDASETTLKKIISSPQFTDSPERVAIAASSDAIKKLPMEKLIKLRHSKNYKIREALAKNEDAMSRLPLAEIVSFANDEYVNVQEAFASSRAAMSRVPVSVILRMSKGGGNYSSSMQTHQNLASNPEVAKKLSWEQLEYSLKNNKHNEECVCIKIAFASNKEVVKKMPKEVVIKFLNDPNVRVRDEMMKSQTARVILEEHLHSTRVKIKSTK